MAQQVVEQTDFMDRVENLLIAIEMYQEVEKKSIARITEILRDNGIEISTEEIRQTDKKEIRERIRIQRQVQKKEEPPEHKVAETYRYETREEEGLCRR